MLRKTFRFHGHGSLNYLYRKGDSRRHGPLLIKYATNPKRRKFRAAVVVSRKVSKSAPKRNRIRRRIYEIVRRASPQITQAYDFSITVFEEQVGTMPHDQLERMVHKLLEDAGILHENQRQS